MTREHESEANAPVMGQSYVRIPDYYGAVAAIRLQLERLDDGEISYGQLFSRLLEIIDDVETP